MSSAGKLDREVTIEKLKSPPDLDPDYGTPIASWVPLVALPGQPTVAERFRAEVQDVPPGRSEAVQLGLSVARNQTRVRIRWRDDIDSSMRVTVHGNSDVIYQIVGGPAEVEGRQELTEMICERYTANG